jgi:hypothetical protein
MTSDTLPMRVPSLAATGWCIRSSTEISGPVGGCAPAGCHAASTNVANEKYVGWISERIQNDIEQYDLTTAITADWSDKGWYIISIGKRVWVYNYRVTYSDGTAGAWSILDLPHEPTCYIIVGSDLCFGTADGKIMRIDQGLSTYDGTAIAAEWEMGDYNFGNDTIQKFIQRVFISIRPRVKTYVDISYQTDRDGSSDTYRASYELTNFDHMDFAHFSFKTNYNPQPFKFKIRAKKFDYFKLIMRTTVRATVLSITLPVRTGGEVRRR